MNIDMFVNSLNIIEKDDLYRRLHLDYVKEDIASRLDEHDFELKTDEDIDMLIDTVARRYVYDGEYDCNLSYWDNIDNLIEYYINTNMKRN